jgi:hypothetical protein
MLIRALKGSNIRSKINENMKTLPLFQIKINFCRIQRALSRISDRFMTATIGAIRGANGSAQRCFGKLKNEEKGRKIHKYYIQVQSFQ